MRISRPLLTALFLTLCEPALAQQVCAQLQGQLAAIDRGTGGTAAQYQQARAAYDNAYRQAQQMGCITVFRVFAPPQCRAVTQNLSQLQANLVALERAATVPAPMASRSAVIAALQANGCTIGGGAGGPRSDAFRTLCVRPEDGYFFPINFATSDDHFTADEERCQAQCVGASLFVHRNPAETMDDAVDLAGQRYVEMPFAYLYRTEYDPSIRCSMASTVAFAGAAPAVPDALPTVPVPLPRPERSEDPETLANRAGGFVPPSRTQDEAVLTADGIRLIGPAFYYAQY